MHFFKKITAATENRPDSISVMCILLALWSLARLCFSVLDWVGSTSLLSLIGSILSLLILISLSALWRMRLWGVYLFLATIAVNIVMTHLMPEQLSVTGTIRIGATGLLAIIYLIIVVPHWSALHKGT